MSYLDIWHKHALKREGKVLKVYKDSLGHWTGGIGHLLTPEDKKIYKLGDPISEEQSDIWFYEDTKKAEKISLKQAKEICIEYPWFIAALISVNFQLGNFATKFKTSYAALKRHEFDAVIENLRRSLWYKQTPVRVNDFIDAIEKARDFKGRPLSATRTIQGAAVSAVAVGGSALESITEIKDQVEPLVYYSEIAKVVFLVLAFAAIGYVAWARIHDRKMGYR